MANKENIENGKETIRNLRASGSTDILSALIVGLHLVKLEKQAKNDNIDRQSIIMFLSDGAPNIRTSYTEGIVNTVCPYSIVSFFKNLQRKRYLN